MKKLPILLAATIALFGLGACSEIGTTGAIYASMVPPENLFGGNSWGADANQKRDKIQ